MVCEIDARDGRGWKCVSDMKVGGGGSQETCVKSESSGEKERVERVRCIDRGKREEHVSVVEARNFARWAPSVRNGSDVMGSLGDF